MSAFAVYLRLGFEHLLDFGAYDHILFLAALCAAHSVRRWRQLLILVTAFTVGHSVSLALATLRLVRADSGLVEFLIPVTIVAAAAVNLAGLRRPTHPAIDSPAPRRDPSAHPRAHAPSPHARAPSQAARAPRYAAALVFGIVHGLGFSSFLRLALGDERDIFVPLLAFNIGLELAQIAVAAAALLLAYAAERGIRLSPRSWNAVVSAAAGIAAAWMAIQRLPFT